MSLEGQVVNGVLPTPLQDLVITGQDTHRILVSRRNGPAPGPCTDVLFNPHAHPMRWL